MDIIAILSAHGIEGEAIGKIEKAISKAISDGYVDKQHYKDKLGEIATLTADLQTAKDDLTTAETWRGKYESEAAKHKATKEQYAAEKSAEERTAAVRKQLEADGANPKAVDLLLKAIDLPTVKLKDGTIENWKEIAEPIKTQYADFFGTVTQSGADVGSPFANVSSGGSSLAETTAQLNAHRIIK